MLYAFVCARACVCVCVCTSGEPLVQLLLFEAVAMERHNSAVTCPLLLPLGPVSTSTTAVDGFSDNACSFAPTPPTLLVHVGSYRCLLTPMLVVFCDSLLSGEPLFTSV